LAGFWDWQEAEYLFPDPLDSLKKGQAFFIGLLIMEFVFLFLLSVVCLLAM